MSRITFTLAQLENRLQTLVEDGTAWLFPRFGSPRQLAALLEEALRGGLRQDINGTQFAPNVFYLAVHPSHASVLQADYGWMNELGKTLLELGEEAGFAFTSPPVVRILASKDVEVGEVKVIAENSLEQLSETAGKVVEQSNDFEELPLSGFLIVNGTQVFPLIQPVINVGRRSDNHLVVDDSRVSRLHAQLRVINRNYVIFDLDSSGGTWVNGERISQHKLIPGDVISLAGVPMVFGQDMIDHSETQDIKPTTSLKHRNT